MINMSTERTTIRELDPESQRTTSTFNHTRQPGFARGKVSNVYQVTDFENAAFGGLVMRLFLLVLVGSNTTGNTGDS